MLERLLETIEKQTVPFQQIIVVDNASTDGAAEVARRAGCEVIAMNDNAGFARAVNKGWRASSASWVAILNSDVELDSQWTERLTAAAVDRESFATGTILNALNRDTVDGTYDLLSRGACAWRAGHGAPLDRSASNPLPIAIAPGTACLFRRSALERLNGFDESFGSYLEDIDLGLRCVRMGLRGVFVPDALAWHHGSATLGRWNPVVVRLISRNQLRLVARHFDRELFLTCLWPIFVGQLLWGLVALRHGAGWAWLRGKWDGFKSLHLTASPSSAVRDFLYSSEREIRSRAREPYWRCYFRLTAGPAAK
jgi:GT2 family glycosyltransferase